MRIFHVVLMLVLGAMALPAAAAPPSAPAENEGTVDPAFAIVARNRGPAWWKATKGDTIVWILGLPHSRTPEGMRWDKTMLKRRIRGARLMLAPFTEWSGFDPDDKNVNPPLLPPPLDEMVREQALRLGENPKHLKYVDVATAFHLRYLYYKRNKLTHDTHREIYKIAEDANVEIVRPPIVRHYWDPADVSPQDPEIASCIAGIVEDVQVPPQRTLDAAAFWAVGDLPNMLQAAPKGVGRICHRFWPGHWERTVDFQTKAIAEALERRGKVVAVVHIGHLIAKDGVLSRLRAQGYEIADPRVPLDD